jgi:2-hydroxychromene-2-carboxylate isomerase
MLATPRLDFFFELASPYACLSALRIAEVSARAGVSVRWRPFLLGPIFKAEGLAETPMRVYPLRGAYMMRDVPRRARRYGFTLTVPPDFPCNPLLAARVAVVALSEGWGEDFSRAIYRAEFQEGRDIGRTEEVARVVAAMERPAEAVLAAAQAPEVKAALRAETEAAMAAGIFGAPSFLVGGELFWGDDRLEDALEWATGRADRASPSSP